MKRQLRHWGFGTVTIIVLLVAAIFAWNGSQTNDNRTANGEVRSSRVIGIAYSIGGKGDLAYNDAAAMGEEALTAAGYDVVIVEPTSTSDLERSLISLIDRGAALIFAVSFLYDPAIEQISKKYKNEVTFAVLDGNAALHPNLYAIKFNAYEGSFLAGAAAAAMTKTKKIGFLGGMKLPVIDEFKDGYIDGAHFINPDIDVSSVYLSTKPDGFGMPGTGKQKARTMFENDADIVYHAAGNSGAGIIEAAKEAGHYAIGVDVDQSHLAPDTVLTSMIKRLDLAMIKFAEQKFRNNLPTNYSYKVGIADEAVQLAPLSIKSTAAVDDAIWRARQALKAKE